MKSKQILRFYFYADSLNRTLDNLIEKNALASADYTRGGEYYSEKICELIRCKQRLSALWSYLNGVIAEFSEKDKNVLRFYGAMRGGLKKLTQDSKRELKRVTVKFARHARAIDRYADAVKLVKKYYCTLTAT